MNYKLFNLDNNLFSMGNMLGTTGSPELMKQISTMAGYDSGAFGTAIDPFRNNFNSFMSNIVQPIYQNHIQLQQANVAVGVEDRIRPITSVEELKKGIPPSMIKPILTYAPIRELAEDGRIEAWGIDVRGYPEEDEYGRLISNGSVPDVAAAMEDGYITYTHEWISTDPVCSLDELDMIEDTRDFMDTFLKGDDTKHIDPTATPYGELRG